MLVAPADRGTKGRKDRESLSGKKRPRTAPSEPPRVPWIQGTGYPTPCTQTVKQRLRPHCHLSFADCR